jgi:hypothetical protein
MYNACSNMGVVGSGQRYTWVPPQIPNCTTFSLIELTYWDRSSSVQLDYLLAEVQLYL